MFVGLPFVGCLHHYLCNISDTTPVIAECKLKKFSVDTCTLNGDSICPGFRGAVMVLRVLKTSFPLACKTWCGTPNYLGFSKS